MPITRQPKMTGSGEDSLSAASPIIRKSGSIKFWLVSICRVKPDFICLTGSIRIFADGGVAVIFSLVGNLHFSYYRATPFRQKDAGTTVHSLVCIPKRWPIFYYEESEANACTV